MSNIGRLIVNGVEFSVQLPDEVITAIAENFEEGQVVELDHWKSKGVAKSISYAIPAPERPASYSQVNYAESIAREFDIELPEGINKAKVCRKFLDEHVAAFQEKLEQKKTLSYLASKTVRTARLIKARDLVDSGLSLEEVADKMEVKLVDTIEKYLRELLAWEKMASESEEYNIVMRMLKEHESGVNLHEKYAPYHSRVE